MAKIMNPGPLELPVDEVGRLLASAADLVLRYAEEVPDGPVAPAEANSDGIREWLADYDFRTPRPAEEILPEVMGALRRWGVQTAHPRYFGLFNPTPTWWGVAGELLAAGVNPQLAAYSHAPAAVEIERHVLRFLADRLGLPETSEASFTVGGAEANLTAVLVALTRRFPGFAERGLAGVPERPVFYASAESHLAWLKIAHLTGLGREAVRLVPVDIRHRLDPVRLRELYEADIVAGRAPFLLVGTAGTTGGGIIDPLGELAGLARDWGIHFHIDAAWAGAVALSDRLRPLLAGVAAADSVTVDAHKWLSAPMGAGMFFTRHHGALADTFHVSTRFMPETDGVDPYTTSVQWSRRFAGLKVFLAMAAVGERGFAAQVERDVALGELLASRLAETGWRRINETPLPVVCVVDSEVDATGSERSMRWHTAVAERVVRGGQAWIAPIGLAGRPALRLCITSYRTQPRDIDQVVAALDKARAAIRAAT
ncbi:pyridoxal phosphate-dependent decarboxylase family protein [Nocardia amikacinitolerans]|uniref:pyridoxal phosphate-dependent decarboxylase family protein n=1 Tax=Nocardia amikacinitolerans TaxID=756689 RepID=UPI0020A36FB2|nr:pyridoxal-dependent decarboxylase [Nocardia amikacinitolerans]MCP2278107.1 Glutamate or tyrosine decarboxylase [Nocardia amikacinitolerans]